MKQRRSVIRAVCVATLGVSAGMIACGGDDSSVSSSDAGADATADASFDAAADVFQSDAGSQDSGTDAGTGCVPADVSGFSAPAYVPTTYPAPFKNQCDNQPSDIQQFWDDCYGGDAASPAACAGYPDAGPGNAACEACIETAADASTYGSVIDGISGKRLNLAGCVQLAEITDAGYGCAESIQAAERCAEAACKTNCPITDKASRAAYTACTQQAATGGCAAFTAVATACFAKFVDAGAGSIATCVRGATDYDTFTAYSAFFCGS